MRIQILVNPNKAFANFARTYGAAPSEIRKGLAQVVESSLKGLHVNISNEAPVRTRKLRQAIRWSMQSKLTGRVFVDQRMKAARYEPFVRMGAPPHDIYPRRAKALWWPARPFSATGKGSFGLSSPIPKVGSPVTKTHPGQKPNPYFSRGVLKSKDIIRRAKELGVNVVLKNVQSMFPVGGSK